MKRVLMTLVILVMIVGICSAGGERERRDQEAIRAAFDSYCEGVANGDAELWLGVHEDQALKMPEGAPMFTIASVRDVQQQRFDAMQANYVVAMEITPAEITVLRDEAYAVGTYLIELKPRADAPPGRVDGKFLTVFRRQSDGEWKIWRDCYNNNVTP
ncbi:MAG TPA: nuclear transport factor 2 family protein [Spirochaetia bacterium]|nr:nuclear transport factor 2 family protein [Spirochaetia bacterium]